MTAARPHDIQNICLGVFIAISLALPSATPSPPSIHPTLLISSIFCCTSDRGGRGISQLLAPPHCILHQGDMDAGPMPHRNQNTWAAPSTRRWARTYRPLHRAAELGTARFAICNKKCCGECGFTRLRDGISIDNLALTNTLYMGRKDIILDLGRMRISSGMRPIKEKCKYGSSFT